MDGSAPLEAGAGALDAALTLIERYLSPGLGVEPARFEHLGWVMDGCAAGITDQPDQPLRQNAVQRRYEVVGLDAHVQEAAQHVHDVVGVNSGENQVTGECRLDGDLRGLVIADFAHHDLVGIVAQDGAQPAGKRQAFFLIDRDLRDPADLIFDRVFNRNDFVFVVLDLIYRRIKGSRFAAARRPGDEHHTVRFFDVAAEAAQVEVVKAHHVECELAELFAHRLFVEHAEHGIFAVDRRHDRNVEVDGALVVLYAETAVLGHAALGNVELAHDLDTGNDRGVMLLPDGRHGMREHAVNAELDDHRVVPSLDVDVAGPPLKGGEDRGIDQPDDRAHVARRRSQLVDGDGLVIARFVFADHVEREAFAGIFQNALRLLRLLKNFGDLLEGRNLGDDPFAKQQADLVDHHQLTGIGNGNRQTPVRCFLQRDEVIPEHQVHRDLLEQIVVQLEVAQIDELAAVPAGNVARPFQLIASGRRRLGRKPPAIRATVHHDCFLLSHSSYQCTSKIVFCR